MRGGVAETSGVHQLDNHLANLKAEHSKANEEAREGQKSIHRLKNELVDSQLECERLQEQLQQVQIQLQHTS